MGTMTNVDPSLIGSAVSQMDNIVSSIAANVSKIKDAMAALDKGWTSAVKADFMNTYRRDEEAMNEMLAQYREVSAMLRETAKEFEKAESEVLSQVSALK